MSSAEISQATEVTRIEKQSACPVRSDEVESSLLHNQTFSMGRITDLPYQLLVDGIIAQLDTPSHLRRRRHRWRER